MNKSCLGLCFFVSDGQETACITICTTGGDKLLLSSERVFLPAKIGPIKVW